MLSFTYFVKPQIPQLGDASRKNGLDINADKAHFVPYPCIKWHIMCDKPKNAKKENMYH
jgi:hypothetical protein